MLRERWTRDRLSLIVVGLGSFYLTYVGCRNLKSFLPWIRNQTYDAQLGALDRALTFGLEPATVLQTILGTGISAHVLSFFYVGYLAFVPITLAAWLVWSRNIAGGLWYTTALSVNWTLGLVSYYLLPSWGPAFAEPSLFWGLPDTTVRALIGFAAVRVGAKVTGHELKARYRGRVFGIGEPEPLPPRQRPDNRELETMHSS